MREPLLITAALLFFIAYHLFLLESCLFFSQRLTILIKLIKINENKGEVMRMRRFDYSVLKEKAWDNEVINYLSQIHELKGRQSVYLQRQPEEMEKLIEIAKVQSTESSNAIEGIRTTQTRLRQLMREKTTPRRRCPCG